MWGLLFVSLLMWGAFDAYPTDGNKQYVSSQLNKFGFEGDVVPTFDSVLNLDAVSALMAKRNQRKADHLKKQQHRRGSFDSLLAGNGFGRNARSDPGAMELNAAVQQQEQQQEQQQLVANTLRAAGQEADVKSRELADTLIRCIYAGGCESIRKLLLNSSTSTSDVGVGKPLSSASLNRNGDANSGFVRSGDSSSSNVLGHIAYQPPPAPPALTPFYYRRIFNATNK